MKLSRSHALFLVGTLAAAACTVENTGDDDSKGGAGSGAKGGSAGAGGSGTGGSAGKGTGGSAVAGNGGTGGSSEAGTGGTGNVANGGEAGTSADEGGAGGYGAGEGGAGGTSAEEGGMSSTSGGAGGEGGAAVCDDTQAAQLGCEDLNTSSCDIKTFLDDECAMTWKNMKPSISNVARNCMLELSQDDLCNDATKTYACIDQALKDACPDATAATDCDTILAYGSCSGKTEVTAESCGAYLSGLTANGRSEMVSCMEGFCDFYSCSEGLN